MNRPLIATLILGLLAAGTALTAAVFYPWPEEVELSGKVGQLLFESFSPSQVRTIEIMKFNRDRQGLERMVLQRKGERWVIPAANDYAADNAIQIGRAISSVLERKVLDKISDDQEDHLKNGVIDPEEFQSVEIRSGLGQKIVLKDRNGQPLANLIVGLPLQNSEQQSLFCVRVPGEPQVYSVAFDADALSTRFQDWVNPNLLNLRTQDSPEGQMPIRVQIDSYRIDATRFAEAPKTPLYSAEIGQVVDRLAVRELKVAAGGDWKVVPPTAAQSSALVEGAMRQLGGWVFPEIRVKPKALADWFRQPGPVADPSAFQPMQEFGFRQVSPAGEPFRLESSGGELTVYFESGLKVTAYFGNVAGSVQTGTKLNRFLILVAAPDEDALKQPAAPTNPDGSALSDEQQRNYQREVDSWNAKIKTAQDLAREFNQRYAPWYYALADEVYQRLVPEIQAIGGAGNPATPPAAPTQ